MDKRTNVMGIGARATAAAAIIAAAVAPTGCMEGDFEDFEERGGVWSGDYAHTLRFWYDKDTDGGSTQLSRAYEDLLDATVAGDQVIMLNKYFRNDDVDDALLDAAERGVSVIAIHRDGYDSDCGPRPPVCGSIFFQHDGVHHKSMMIRKASGTVHALVGSFNLRDRDSYDRRQHTGVQFTVSHATDVWNLYYGEALRLRGIPNDHPTDISLATESSGTMRLTLHPSVANPVRDLLAQVGGCDGKVWASYFRIEDDAVGGPALAQLERLDDLGCTVRVLADNNSSESDAEDYGLNAHNPDWNTWRAGTLGHKLVSVPWAGRHYMIQSSANLRENDHTQSQHNLTLTLVGNLGGFYDNIREELHDELKRYW